MSADTEAFIYHLVFTFLLCLFACFIFLPQRDNQADFLIYFFAVAVGLSLNLQGQAKQWLKEDMWVFHKCITLLRTVCVAEIRLALLLCLFPLKEFTKLRALVERKEVANFSKPERIGSIHEECGPLGSLFQSIDTTEKETGGEGGG